jgi:hypothetical protein
MSEVNTTKLKLIRDEVLKLGNVKNFFIRPNIPADKVGRAIENYCRSNTVPGDVEALFDDTVSGSAKDGFIITADSLLMHGASSGPKFFSFNDIQSVKLIDKNIFINGEIGMGIDLLFAKDCSRVSQLIIKIAEISNNEQRNELDSLVGNTASMANGERFSFSEGFWQGEVTPHIDGPGEPASPSSTHIGPDSNSTDESIARKSSVTSRYGEGTIAERSYPISLVMDDAEISVVDSKVEQMLDWSKSRQAEAEQLILDSTRLLACTGDRMDRLSNQGFFKRCWSRFSGDAAALERANTADLIQIQKIGLRYINMISEQQILMAHSLLSLQNNLLTLAVKEEETRGIITLLAQRTLDRFENLESRTDHLEISSNLHGWLLGLDEREYDTRIPSENMRLFQIINDFYHIKNDFWNFNDLMFLRKSLRIVKLDPKRKISINTFIERLVDDIYTQENGFNRFNLMLNHHKPETIENFSLFSVNQISSPVFLTIHGINYHYNDRLNVVETLSDDMSISQNEALKRLIRKSIKDLNVDLDYEFSLAETAIEILGCLRLSNLLSQSTNEYKDKEDIKINYDFQSDNDSQLNNDSETDDDLESSISDLSNSLDELANMMKEFSNQKPDIETIIEKHRKNSKILTDLYFRPDIPLKKLLNAISKYGGDTSPEDVIMLYDNTLWGGAREGLFCTENTIFIHENLEVPCSFDFWMIDTIKAKNSDVIIDDRKCLHVLGDSANAWAIAEFLRDIFHIVKD